MAKKKQPTKKESRVTSSAPRDVAADRAALRSLVHQTIERTRYNTRLDSLLSALIRPLKESLDAGFPLCARDTLSNLTRMRRELAHDRLMERGQSSQKASSTESTPSPWAKAAIVALFEPETVKLVGIREADTQTLNQLQLPKEANLALPHFWALLTVLYEQLNSTYLTFLHHAEEATRLWPKTTALWERHPTPKNEWYPRVFKHMERAALLLLNISERVAHLLEKENIAKAYATRMAPILAFTDKIISRDT